MYTYYIESKYQIQDGARIILIDLTWKKGTSNYHAPSVYIHIHLRDCHNAHKSVLMH